MSHQHLIDYLYDPNAWIGFLTLCLLEIVLGIDNVIFLAIAANRLERHARPFARFFGLMLALGMRVVFLISIVWLVQLTTPLFSVGQLIPQGLPRWLAAIEISWRDFILIAGGLFLIFKATGEIGAEIFGSKAERVITGARAFFGVILQIMLLDLVFSFDSVLTAVGLTRDLPIMIAAVVVAIFVMLVASGPVSAFIARHPPIKMMALVFIFVVGAVLIAGALDPPLPPVYLYLVIGASFAIEIFKLVLGARKSDRASALQNPVLRILGLALVLALGGLVAWSGRFAPLEFYINGSLAVLAFQFVLEALNALARAHARRLAGAAHAP